MRRRQGQEFCFYSKCDGRYWRGWKEERIFSKGCLPESAWHLPVQFEMFGVSQTHPILRAVGFLILQPRNLMCQR